MKPRQIRIEGDVGFVPLTCGKEALIDARDAALVGGKNWCVNDPSSTTLYASRRVLQDGRWVKEWLHRVILPAPKGVLIDHINMNGLDCRRANLRLATLRQNALNRRNRNRHGLKGISQIGDGFAAAITTEKGRLYLGYFCTAEAAHAAYCAASAVHHRQFGRTT